jgi:uncharacterized protein
MRRRIFVDTSFLVAVIDDTDKYHTRVKTYYRQLVRDKWTLVTTEAVLVELGNALAELKWRREAYLWLKDIQESRTIFTVLPATTQLLQTAITLYGSRPDKEWGMTDCLSFVVMEEQNLRDALTFDHHFEQAGYNILPK